MWRSLILAAILTQSANAQSLHSDAFGMYLGDDAKRSTWSGEFQTCLEQSCTSEKREAGETYTVENYFGQKSMRAGDDLAMAMGIFTDRNGNLVQDETAFFYADSGNSRSAGEIRDGVSHHNFIANTRADQYLGGVRSQDIQSIAEVYRVVADLATVSFSTQQPKAPIRQGNMATISSGSISDQYGNTAPLGTFLQAILVDEAGRHTVAPMSAQDGQAKSIISTNQFQGAYEIQISLLNRSADKSTINVAAERLTNIDEILATFDPQTKSVQLQARGLQTDQGHLIADAAQIDMKITQATGEMLERRVWTLEGNVQTRFPLNESSFPIELEIASAYGSLFSTIDIEDLRIAYD